MGLFDRFKNAAVSDRFKMVEDRGNGFYAWDGKLYQSDIVRSCIKPQVKAIGKAVGKHIRASVDAEGHKTLSINPDANMRFLLEEPNPYMTGQMMQEKVANQLVLNGNAFILIIRDAFDIPVELYPIPAESVETKYMDDGQLWLRFWYKNGKHGDFPYTEIIHLRDDFYDNDIFGETPAEALTNLMNCVTTIDQGIVKAVKNSSVIRWLLHFKTPLRPEDLQKNVKEFADNYLSIESNTFGAAGVDSKADANRIEPKDYVPNASQTEAIRNRLYSFFGTNDNIVRSDYTEDQWNAYYETRCEPVITQMSNAYTIRLFSRRERGYGNKIVFESANLMFANTATKLNFVSMVDRGALTPNEWRALFNMAPLENGDTPIRRLDTDTIGGATENEASNN